MLSDHDEALVARLRAGAGCTRAAADDPDAVARAIAAAGAQLVGVADLAAVLDAAPAVAAGPPGVDPRAVGGEGERLALLARRVLDAEEVVAAARSFERERAARVLVARPRVPDAPEVDDEAPEDGAHADHQAVRFALVVLVLAQLGGIAVFVAAGDLLGVVAPAVALVGLALVVAFHQRPARTPAAPDRSPSAAAEPAPWCEPDLTASPTVRAAEAHLRRQRAAWKVAWWEREQPVPDPMAWLTGGPRTVVCVDAAGAVDAEAYATMTAGLPAVIRVVLLEPRQA